jgi:branched-chain amino acid transport system ATP-binding protein
MSPPLLEIDGVTKRFGGLSALNDLSFEVGEGEIVSVIGPNGAGKSTVFNVITGLYPPDEGDVRFHGQSIVGFSPNRITRAGIARTFQNVHLFPNMTVLENAMVGQHSRSKAGVFGAIFRPPAVRREEEAIRERAKECLGFFGSRLAGYRQDQSAFMLSYANRRRLEMARALATDPTMMLLDEPTAGMNPTETTEMQGLVAELKAEGLTILLIEHKLDMVMRLSDRVIVMDEGKKIAEGAGEDVRNDAKVIEAYLGHGLSQPAAKSQETAA